MVKTNNISSKFDPIPWYKVKFTSSATATARKLTSGVWSQWGILSPIIFTLFTADLEKWVNISKIFVYADDTTSTQRAGIGH